MRWFFILGFGVRLFAGSFDEVMPSSPEEILSLTSDLLVDGYVSVSSGQISLSEIDLRVRGAQDLLLKRTYVPPQILGRYEDKDKLDQLMLGKALHQLETKGWVVNPHLWAGYNRNSSYFQVRDPQGFVLEFQIQGNKGVLKTSSYGCSNLRGENPSSSVDIRNIELLVDGDLAKVVWPDGIQRQYFKCYPGVYRLEKELLSNGKTIRYEYNDQGLAKILSCDPTGQFVYASITRVRGNHYLGSDGREVDLVYETREIKGEYKKDAYKEKVSFQFPVMTRSSNSVYTNTVGYNERTLLNSYDAKDYPVSCTYFQNKNTPSRIQTFSNPSSLFSFSYDPAIAGQKGGSTTVTHPDGAQTVYRFSKLFLLEAIENWFQGQLINKKTFEYDHKQHIKSIETLDGNGNLLIAKRFECDAAGNATMEKTEGDFGIFCKKRKFDKNRVTFEEYDDGLQYAFTYLGDTRLVTSKTILESGNELRKTLYSYDDACNLIQNEEVGKTKTVYTLYQNSPHLHRVEWEEKSDWNGVLIYKIHYGYDVWGNTNREDHFGADGKIAYTIERTYNQKGELLNETNPVGEMAVYEYDPRGRCFYEEPFSNGLMIRREFDTKRRLKVLSEGDHRTFFDYNASDELILKTDYLGFTTTYTYDPVHGKPILIQEGDAVTEIVYDAFGREKEKIDPYKAKTLKSYNSYGDVTKITHPEGGIEVFSYFPNGLLKSHKNGDGLITAYSYDALGRTKEKTVGAFTTTFFYDGYDLYKTIDAEGFTTEYQYDLTGKKTEEKRENRVTGYGYDALGFLAWEERGDCRTSYTNDSLGRVCEKSIDGVLNTSWTYDQGGNVCAIQQGDSLSTYRFDSHDRLVEKINPEGHKTEIFYEKGPQILLKRTTDPMGIVTVETYNPKLQLLKKEVAGQLVEEFEYDKLFRLKKQDHLIFDYTQNGKRQSIKEANLKVTRYSYTPGDLLLTKQKPDGTILLYEYDAQGRLAKVGTREFRYDALDRMIGGTGFSRKLDAFGNVIREEWSNGLWQESDYDDWDRPLVRKLPDQSKIEYEYKGPFLKKVTRISIQGKQLYSHAYLQYDEKGNLRLEKGLFPCTYDYDRTGRRVSQNSPYYNEVIVYDPSGHLIQRGDRLYTYDSTSQMISESGRFSARYDAHYNLQELNGESIAVDPLNQIVGQEYDLNGNLLKPGFVYDEFDQLIESAGEKHVYDALGRRIQRGRASFIYIGDEEIGAFERGEPKELKIPGFSTHIAIEIDCAPYAPIIDVQGVTRLLIDWKANEIFKENACDAFGVGLTDAIPYAYAGKRYDSKTGFLYFGQRYYDPSLRRWLTPDPVGSSNHSNLYQYLFNSPYLYKDSNGEFAFAIPLLFWGAELALPAISACITALTYTAAAGVVAYGGYKAIEAINKNTEVYAPDRPLPLTPDGVPIADVDVPHTQLGTKGSKRRPGEKYPQAREFDSNGKPVKTIDFTDHGMPWNHPNPHEHPCEPNPTGGTPGRGGAKPLGNWSY